MFGVKVTAATQVQGQRQVRQEGPPGHADWAPNLPRPVSHEGVAGNMTWQRTPYSTTSAAPRGDPALQALPRRPAPSVPGN